MYTCFIVLIHCDFTSHYCFIQLFNYYCCKHVSKSSSSSSSMSFQLPAIPVDSLPSITRMLPPNIGRDARRTHSFPTRMDASPWDGNDQANTAASAPWSHQRQPCPPNDHQQAASNNQIRCIMTGPNPPRHACAGPCSIASGRTTEGSRSMQCSNHSHAAWVRYTLFTETAPESHATGTTHQRPLRLQYIAAIATQEQPLR